VLDLLLSKDLARSLKWNMGLFRLSKFLLAGNLIFPCFLLLIAD
jgi:hypothetical protein